jgi:hypothetical protein
VFDRYDLAPLTWQGLANNSLMPDLKPRFQIWLVFRCRIGQISPWPLDASPLPNYLVQSDARLLPL